MPILTSNHAPPFPPPFFPTTILSRYGARGITGIKNGFHSTPGSDFTVWCLKLQEITISCKVISILHPQMSQNQSFFVYRYEFHHTKTRNYCMDKLFWLTKRYAYTWLKSWVPEKGGRKGGRMIWGQYWHLKATLSENLAHLNALILFQPS